jgi:hypothetical protein
MSEEIKTLQQKIADLKNRLPAHSVKPVMIAELEELEAELSRLQREEQNSSKLKKI